jgi:hypothetical protein
MQKMQLNTDNLFFFITWQSCNEESKLARFKVKKKLFCPTISFIQLKQQIGNSCLQQSIFSCWKLLFFVHKSKKGENETPRARRRRRFLQIFVRPYWLKPPKSLGWSRRSKRSLICRLVNLQVAPRDSHREA